MKVLVDRASDEIRGKYEEPLNFSVSGKYIVDIPSGFSIDLETNVVSDLVTAKIDAFKALHPTLPNHFSDELLASPDVDTVESVALSATAGFPGAIIVAPFKRVAIKPNASLVTSIHTITVPFNTVFIHFHGFTLFSEPGPNVTEPGPQRLLYNYDPNLSDFFDFDPGFVKAAIRDSGNTTDDHIFVPDVEESFTMADPYSFRLAFTNNDPDNTYYLSDWIMLYGQV